MSWVSISNSLAFCVYSLTSHCFYQQIYLEDFLTIYSVVKGSKSICKLSGINICLIHAWFSAWTTHAVRNCAHIIAFTSASLALVICGLIEQKYIAYCFMIISQVTQPFFYCSFKLVTRILANETTSHSYNSSSFVTCTEFFRRFASVVRIAVWAALILTSHQISRHPLIPWVTLSDQWPDY
jgi:hypothetical protein